MEGNHENGCLFLRMISQGKKLHLQKKRNFFWSKSSLFQKLIEQIYLPQIKKSPVGAGFAVEGDLIHV